MTTATHSADHGEMYVVQVTYSTHADGSAVVDGDAVPTTLHGPFVTADAAAAWADTYPADTDVTDVAVVPLNVTPDGGTR